MFDLCHQECWDSELGREYEFIGFCRTRRGATRFLLSPQLWNIPVTCKQAEVPLNYLNLPSRRQNGLFLFLWQCQQQITPRSLSSRLEFTGLQSTPELEFIFLCHPAAGNKQASWSLKLATNLRQKIILELPFSMLYLFCCLYKARLF